MSVIGSNVWASDDVAEQLVVLESNQRTALTTGWQQLRKLALIVLAPMAVLMVYQLSFLAHVGGELSS